MHRRVTEEKNSQDSFFEEASFTFVKKIVKNSNLLAPSGALVVIMVYYIHINPVFQIFQILPILKWKWKWKWKDPTCAIFFKSMGFKDIEYDIPVYQM